MTDEKDYKWYHETEDKPKPSPKLRAPAKRATRLKVKRLCEGACLPQYQSDGAAGLDIYCKIPDIMAAYHVYYLPTGLALEIPEGHYGQLCLRSSTVEMGLSIPHGLGIIDSDYRGEILVPVTVAPRQIVKTHYGKPQATGDRIELGRQWYRMAQLLILPIPHPEVEEVDEINETTRGTGGFGSTNDNG